MVSHDANDRAEELESMHLHEITHLENQLAQERAAREAAEKERDELRVRANDAEKDLEETRITLGAHYARVLAAEKERDDLRARATPKTSCPECHGTGHRAAPFAPGPDVPCHCTSAPFEPAS